MSLATPIFYDNGQQRQMSPGDTPCLNERVDTSNTTAGASTWTANQALAAILWRTGPGAGYNETTPDSATWINAMLQNQLVAAGATTPGGVQTGVSYRMRFVNTVAFAATIVAGTNVSLVAGPDGTSTVAASKARDFLVTVLNGTPQQVYAATTTNASAVITGLSAAQTQNLSPGMAVSGTGIAGGSTILSVQPGVGVTLSANATATGSLVALTFSPRVEFRAIGNSY
jgi:hypothetical protein